MTVPPDDGPRPVDDYLVEQEERSRGPSASAQVLRVVTAFLVILMAAASLALFWVVGMLLGLW